jgi:hypothetical protein
MPIKTEVACDHCNKDLSESSNSIDWRLELKNVKIPSWNGAVTDMMIYPRIDSDKAFCTIICLKLWLHDHLERKI